MSDEKETAYEAAGRTLRGRGMCLSANGDGGGSFMFDAPLVFSGETVTLDDLANNDTSVAYGGKMLTLVFGDETSAPVDAGDDTKDGER